MDLDVVIDTNIQNVMCLCRMMSVGNAQHLKLTSHGTLLCLCSADLSKSFPQLIYVNIYLFSIFFSIYFARGYFTLFIS